MRQRYLSLVFGKWNAAESKQDRSSAVWYARLQRDKIDTAIGVDVAGALVQFSDSVKLFGVNLEATLSFDRHVNEVIRSCSYHTRALRYTTVVESGSRQDDRAGHRVRTSGLLQ